MERKVVYMMKRLDIRLAAQYSGIKAHTIRVWEQRYDLLKPQKGIGNRREYTREDIINLMDIALLTKYGYSISKLAKFSREKIKEITDHLSSSAAGSDISINKLLTCYLLTDIFNFEVVINEFAAKKELHLTITELIIPFIERTELFSYHNASSNFVVNILKRKIITAIDHLYLPQNYKQTAILFLPAGQHFDLILLYLSYQLQHSGYRIIYLGGNTMTSEVLQIISTYAPNHMVTYISPREKTNVAELQQFAHKYLENGQLFIADSSNFRNSLMERAIVSRV
jgi:MerR family transcriptional regulator, light-induced transcriptional regulator